MKPWNFEIVLLQHQSTKLHICTRKVQQRIPIITYFLDHTLTFFVWLWECGYWSKYLDALQVWVAVCNNTSKNQTWKGIRLIFIHPPTLKLAYLLQGRQELLHQWPLSNFAYSKKGICYSPALSLHQTMPRRNQRWLPDLWVSIPGFRGWLLSRVVARISREQGSWILGGRIFCLRLQCL